MSYKRDIEDFMEESTEARFETQSNRPGVEIWPDDEDALWLMRHSDPARAVICRTPEFASSPFCGVGHH
jgi:hypothetical protein